MGRPRQLETHQHGKKAPMTAIAIRRDHVLNADYFMIRAENVLPPEAQFGMCVFSFMSAMMDIHVR